MSATKTVDHLISARNHAAAAHDRAARLIAATKQGGTRAEAEALRIAATDALQTLQLYVALTQGSLADALATAEGAE